MDSPASATAVFTGGPVNQDDARVGQYPGTPRNRSGSVVALRNSSGGGDEQAGELANSR